MPALKMAPAAAPPPAPEGAGLAGEGIAPLIAGGGASRRAAPLRDSTRHERRSAPRECPAPFPPPSQHPRAPPLPELLRARAAARPERRRTRTGCGSAMAARREAAAAAGGCRLGSPFPGAGSWAAGWRGAALRLALAVLLHTARAEKEGEIQISLPFLASFSGGGCGAVAAVAAGGWWWGMCEAPGFAAPSPSLGGVTGSRWLPCSESLSLCPPPTSPSRRRGCRGAPVCL